MSRDNLERDLAAYDRALRETRDDLIEANRRAEYLPVVIHALKDMIGSTRDQIAILDTQEARR